MSALLLALVTLVAAPYHVHWSNITFDERRDDWVETQTFEADFATLGAARAAARDIVRLHRNEETFPVEIARFDDDGDLVCLELYYTGGEHEIRIRDGRVLPRWTWYHHGASDER